MNADLGAVSNRVLEALFNGMYQGLLLAGLFGFGVRLLPRSNAATRYAVGFVGMLIVASLPLLHLVTGNWEWLLRQGSSLRNIWTGFAIVAGEGVPQPAYSVQSEREQALPEVPFEPQNPDDDSLALAATDESSPFPLVAGGHGAGVVSSLRRGSAPTVESPNVSTFPPPPWEPVLSDEERSAANGKSRSFPAWNLIMPFEIAAALISSWLLLSTWRLLNLARQCLALRSMKFRARSVSDDLQTRFEWLRQEMGVRRNVGIALCDRVGTPIAAGFFKPMVLLPLNLSEREEPKRLDGILRHELAHVRRWDDWTNLVQQVIHALFFFHPGLSWLSSRLTLEREIACDDHALASISSRREYALLLAEFASRMNGRTWAAAPGVWSKKGQLKERINMIMNGKRNASTRLAGASAGVLTVGAAMVALLVMQTGPRVALASEPAEGSEPALAALPALPPEPPAPAGGAPSADVHISTDSVVVVDGKALAVISGPRRKDGSPIALPSPHPTPVYAAVAAVEPVEPPEPPRAPKAPKPPKPDKAESKDGDLERRLERLERMIEKLDRKETRSENFQFEMKGHDFDPKFNEKLGKMQWEYSHKMSKEEMDRIQEHARRAGEQAARDAERALKDMDRVIKDVEIKRQLGVDVNRGKDGAPLENRKKALENQRRSLEKQMESLERQIEAIEREEERAEEARERADEARERAEEQRERARERAENARQNRNSSSNESRSESSNSNSSDSAPSAENPKQRKQ